MNSSFFPQSESAGFAASIDVMVAGEDGPEMLESINKNPADESPSVS